MLNFLTGLHKQGLGYSAINTAKSAISSFVFLISNIQIGTNILVKQFMKGIFNERPTLPRYNVTWDVSTVLHYLASLYPLNNISLKFLGYKLLMLLALTTGQRVQTLYLLDIRNIVYTENYIKLRIGDLLKQSKAGKHLQELYIEAYNDPSLCVVSTFNAYLQQTEEYRGSTTQLFISFQKPFKAVTKSTLSHWIKSVLGQAGIDLNSFRPHSTRSASTSAVVGRVPIDTILRTAGWTKDCVFRKFYKRNITNDSSFSTAVLNTL